MIPLEIRPHKFAPLFNGPDASRVLEQLVAEMSSPNLNVIETLRQAFRQAAFVNLWFFAKYVAGYNGPYYFFNEDLHVEMCNFRQSDYCMAEGARWAVFMPRGHVKTMVNTEAGTGWRKLRDPDHTTRISNALSDFAHDFMQQVERMFDDNEMTAWLFGQKTDPGGCYYVYDRRTQERWNDTEMVMPNRQRNQREASVEAGGVGGSSENRHFDEHIVDDPLGLKALNADRGSNAIMMDTRNWFFATEKPLLKSYRSTVGLIMTRYAVDDLAGEVIEDCKVNLGYPIPDCTPKPDGRWSIYYRKAIEYDEVIFPESFTKESLDELAVSDWWTYQTQYMNDPQSSGLVELYGYPVKNCEVDHDGERWWITYREGEEEKKVKMADCDLLFVCDPAATEKYMGARTSRTSLLGLATHSSRKRFIVSLQADYVAASKVFDWLFAAAQKFEGYYRRFLFEANAGFKAFYSLLREEQQKRGRSLHLDSFSALGDKDARIRTVVEPELMAGNIYCPKAYLPLLKEELIGFPMSKKKDCLDALSTAIRESVRPLTGEEEEAAEEADNWWKERSRNCAGY